MTFEEMEHGLKGLQDNMTVQGVMMNRVGNNLDRLEAVVAENSAAIARNTEVVAKLADGMIAIQGATKALTEVVEGHEQQLQTRDQQLQIMQAAMTALFERMDRFIRGLETDGHKGRGEI
jgi:ABC-type transporter Mla subunit MlaD